MRVLGVDPGLTRCGVGIVDGAVGSPLSLVEVGVILTPVESPLEQRLLDLDQQYSYGYRTGCRHRFVVGS